MKIYAPTYYKDFKCIADKCKHSCCIGWEIDIDEETYAYYKSVEGEFGARLRAHIDESGDAPHFVLDKRECCPFLNANGLCDIYTNLGEGALCQICTDHPRFRNFFEGRVEIGLGLCCEAAAELILKRTDKTDLVLLDAEEQSEDLPSEEEAFFAFREQIFSIVQNREHTIQERIDRLRSDMGISLPQCNLDAWVSFYLALEHLDILWVDRLNRAKENTYMPPDVMTEQLLCYFVYRHLADGIYEGTLKNRLAFALHATQFLCTIAENETDFLDVCRMYSAEIEYSEENLQEMLVKLA